MSKIKVKNKQLSELIEGIKSIYVSKTDRLKMFDDDSSAIDENFDPIVVDSLNGLIGLNLITNDIAQRIRKLYQEADSALSGLSWGQEDDYLESESEQVLEWRKSAKKLVEDIYAHNRQII
jgi:hypothetical protein